LSNSRPAPDVGASLRCPDIRNPDSVSPTPSYDIDSWRSKIPLLQSTIPMNNCSHAPLLDGVREAAERYTASWNEDGMDWDAWVGEVEAARRSFAGLIDADPEDVAVCASVSQAVASIAGALDYSGSRKTVVASMAEFPTVGHVWLAHKKLGARLRWVAVADGEVPLDGYRSAVDDDTLIVSACHGYYQTGFKQDLDAIVGIARAKGALLFVDAYQTMGTHPIDVTALDVDFLASGNLKYLMGAPGIAFLYVKREIADRLEPTLTGWFGRKNPFAFTVDALDWADGARRFDMGTPPISGAYVARAGMDAIAEVGPAAIRDWTQVLSGRLIEGGRARGLELLGPDDPTRKTPSNAFSCPGDSHRAEVLMRERGVLASARGPAVRLAPHFYSTLDDVDAALDALAEVFAQLSAE
ncbi:MAG: aminotransferase class V-fold PLP-dependent enzyme, partial [Longimicrobiales bacterium]